MPDDSKLTRCIRVLDALYNRGEMATRDVMGLLGVDRQTAMRDLRSLRDAGVPLNPVGHGAQRRYRLESAYRRTRMRITSGDVLALRLGRQLLGFVRDSPSPDWLAELRELLAPAFAPGNADAVQVLSRVVLVDEPHPVFPNGDPVFGEVLAALLQERELRVVDQDGRVWPRLQPLAFGLHRRMPWLLANDPASGSTVELRVDRLAEAERLGTSFRYPRRFDPQTAFTDRFGVEPTATSHGPIILRFSPAVADRARRWRWHPSQELIARPDGSLELRLAASGADLVRMIVAMGGEVEVIEPESLRAEVVDTHERALRRYRADLAAKG